LNEDRKQDNGNRKIVDRWLEIYKLNHESFTPVQILEQVTIMLGVLAFITGFWFVLYRIVQSLL